MEILALSKCLGSGLSDHEGGQGPCLSSSAVLLIFAIEQQLLVIGILIQLIKMQ